MVSNCCKSVGIDTICGLTGVIGAVMRRRLKSTSFNHFELTFKIELNSSVSSRTNMLSPGPTKAELALEVVGKEAFDALGSTTPIGRVGDPSETGAVAAFLASSHSSYMAGGEVFVDGGLAQV